MKKTSAKGGGSGAGVKSALSRNPNKATSINDSPEGPFSHTMGHTGDGGMKGDATATKGGATFHFK